MERRTLLRAAAAILAVPVLAQAQQAPPAPPTIAGNGANAGAGALGAMLRLGADGRVTLASTTSELGQGTHTAHAMIIADELGCALDAVSVVTGQPEPALRLAPVNEMYTGASFGIRHWEPRLRRAAAAARVVLVQAAAARWGVEPGSVALEDGVLRHAASDRRIPMGELVAEAARLPLPETPALRPREERRIVGRAAPRADIPDKTNGRAHYGADIRLPGMLYAVAKLPARFRSEPEGFDRAGAMNVRGVVDVVPIARGVAVVAQNTWAAMKGAEALVMRWKATDADGLDNAEVSRRLREGLARTDAVQRPRNDGDWEAVRGAASRVVEAVYEVPYLAHAPMETENATVRIAGERAEIWIPTQHQDWAQQAVARVANIAPANVTVHTTASGGGFGRRLMVEVAEQAAQLARATGRPVQLLWTREDEFAQGYYRPAFAARMEAALDAQGRVTGLSLRGAGGSVMYDYRPWLFRNPNFVDPFALQSVTDTRYRFGAFRAEYARVDLAPRVWLWRSVGSSQYGFFLESFLDEVAAAAGRDPLTIRHELLAHDTRALAVLNTAAERGGYGQPTPPGRARGIAYMEAYGSLCAQVAEVAMEQGQPRVHKVTVAIDSGDVINPDTVVAQMQGSVVWGLSAARYEGVSLKDGAAQTRNFDTYRLLRMSEAPEVEVHIIRSGQPLGGIGEPGVPPVAPAVANAVFALTGTRVRRLPFEGQRLTPA
jgi:isoquinoline 1-oxidoreductase beta subunit